MSRTDVTFTLLMAIVTAMLLVYALLYFCEMPFAQLFESAPLPQWGCIS